MRKKLSILQAIEYIAFNWEPLENEDAEILSGRNRLSFFNEDTTNKLFAIKNAALTLEEWINSKKLKCKGIIYKDKIDIIGLKKSLYEGKISEDDYLSALKPLVPSTYLYVLKSHPSNYKKNIVRVDSYKEAFKLHYSDDINYYKNPYHSDKDICYLFYIKANCGYDIFYLDLEFDCEELKNICLSVLIAKDNKTLHKQIDQKVINLAKILRKEQPSITNNGAAKIISQRLKKDNNGYPAHSQIIKIIEPIIPQNKRGRINL